MAKVVLVLMIGWFLGYVHHFVSSRPEIEGMRYEASVLSTRLAELEAAPPLKVKVKTTAYSNDKYSINVRRWRDGRTATNKVARRGYVAADWGVFPPGTRFYIPGYGEGVVEDRGGLVKGQHLDLFVDSREEALRWGVQQLDVYVLELGGQGRIGLTGPDEEADATGSDVKLAEEREIGQASIIKASF